MTHVYIATTSISKDPVTIIAHNPGQASAMFQLWLEAHDPKAKRRDVLLCELGVDDITEQHNLPDIAASGIIGVAWWSNDCDCWLIGPADGPALGSRTPPAPPLECFDFKNVDKLGDLFVFAPTRVAAVALLQDHWRATYVAAASYSRIVRISPWLLVGVALPMRTAMFAGKVGIGEQGEDGVWKLRPS